MAARCNRAGNYIFVLWFLLLLSSFFSSPNLSGCSLPYFDTWCGLSVNLECMSEMCCTRLAGNARRKKIAIWAPSHNFVGPYLRNWGMYWQSEKNLLSSNISSTCPNNIMTFRPLMAEIDWRVWSTPANFNSFRVLAALLHGILVVGVSQTVALNRGRHLYSTGGHRVGIGPHSSLVMFSAVPCHSVNGHPAQQCGHYIFVMWLLSYGRPM